MRLKQYLENKKIGFFGAGHLARAFLKLLLDVNFPKDKILICHNGTQKTRDHLTKLNLSKNIVSKEELCKESKVILYFVRPQEYQAAKNCQIDENSLIISFLAGATIKKLKEVFPYNKILRALPSSPNTMDVKDGIVAFYPEPEQDILELFSVFKIINLQNEEEMHFFCSVCACLPNLFVYLDGKLNEEEIKTLFKNTKIDSTEIIDWAKRIAPKNLNKEEKQQFLTRAATKGGINEAIFKALDEHKSPQEALKEGIKKSKKLN